MKPIRAVFSIYRPAFAKTVVYMLQAVEYQPVAYLKWFWRTQNFSTVTYRKDLAFTRPARLLLTAFKVGALAEIIAFIVLLALGISSGNDGEIILAFAVLLITPILWAHLIILPLALGRFFIINPQHAGQIRRSGQAFKDTKAIKIAIAGSYGKTTMKEILLTVLSEGKKVAATPANKNVATSHAIFSQKLDGDEDVLIIEYGEGKPGDVAAFAKTTQPDMGVITGLAPAHLDKYKTLEAAGRDIFSLADFLAGENVYVNGDSEAARKFIKKTHTVYSDTGVGDWKVDDVTVGLQGVSFSLGSGSKKLKLNSQLLGRHQVGPLALAAYLGRHFGLSDNQIKTGIAKIKPFEHRMRPYQLAGGWVIDDTYNGNIEGVKAGLALLAELPAERKIYVTPGLVDQGGDSSDIHRRLGQLIAEAKPDKVVLIKHSVTDDIAEGMDGYHGELVIEDDPLNFYTNLDKFIATGDLVLMQNDWPDQYS